MTTVCAGCGTMRLDPGDPWCHRCHDSTLTVDADPPITKGQRITICQLFIQLGEMHRATRMRELSFWAGRYISDYDQLTAAEATTAIHKLRERNRGPAS